MSTMFCPVCRLEYRPGFNVCSDCNVNLVASLPPVATAQPDPADRAVSAWSGNDPVAFSAIVAALDAADIPRHPLSSHDQYATAVPSIGPLYRVLVRAGDVKRAEVAIRGALAPNAPES
jgi:hypothetical protein